MQPQTTVAIESVTTVDGIAALGPCYERLHRVTGNTLPFSLHEWHTAWCRHFLNCNPRIRDRPLFYVLRNAAAECVAIVPFIVSERRIGPLRFASIGLLGAEGSLQWQPALSAYVLDLAPTWDEFRRSLKRNIRESLRHCYNSLRRDNLRFELRVIEALPELHRGLERFLELHVMRANLKCAAPHPNRFASRISRDFLHEVCERLSKRGAVRLFQLEVGGQVVAMRIGFLVGDSLYLYYSGFDPRWSRYSVMTTTVAEAIKYAIAQGLKTVNLSPSLDVSKARWGPRQVDYKSAYEHGARLRSRVAGQAYLRARSGEGLRAWLLQHLSAARRHWH